MTSMPRKLPHFTQQQLWSLMDYHPATGEFVWRTRPETSKSVFGWNRRYAGQPVGAINGHGYISTRIDGREYSLHLLAFFYMTGEWPALPVDHENTIRSDNSWVNLRLATRSENGHNRGPNRNNRSGHKGVSWHGRRRRWVAQIRINGKTRHVGYFTDRTEAIEAYEMAAKQCCGPFHRSAPNAVSYY